MTEAEILAGVDLTPSPDDLAIDLRQLAAGAVLGCELLRLAGQVVAPETLLILSGLRRAVAAEERLANLQLLAVGVLGGAGSIEEALGVAGSKEAA